MVDIFNAILCIKYIIHIVASNIHRHFLLNQLFPHCAKMLISSRIQLCFDFQDVSVQDDGSDTDFVATHLIAIIRLNNLACCRI